MCKGLLRRGGADYNESADVADQEQRDSSVPRVFPQETPEKVIQGICEGKDLLGAGGQCCSS